MEETNLSNMLEEALRQIQEDNAKASQIQVDDTDEVDLDSIANSIFENIDVDDELDDDDIEEYNRFLEEEDED